MAQEIQFFVKSTNEIITFSHNEIQYFVLENKVWIDNGDSCESQEATVQFEDFVEECPNIGWRVIETKEV